PLLFGTAAVPADSIYGLAFTVNYDTALVKADSVLINFSTSWIGIIGTDMIAIQHNDPVNGQLHVGMTRIDHNNISGFGEIAKISVVTVDNVSGRIASMSVFDTLTFSLSDVTVIDKDENTRNVNLSSGSIIVQDSTTGIYEFLSPDKIKIYPNPVKDKLFVENYSGISINEISITNIVGEKMETQSLVKRNSVEIKNLKNFSNGIYFIQIKTSEGTVVKKFSVIK
ncbi:MAG: T9SS type A sorting domain-containing protein, partial [Bacteroidia bacterium]